MLPALSWKNVWRNRLRSAIVAASIALGLLGGVFSAAFMNGMGRQTIQNAVATELAHVQLHTPAYDEEPLASHLIPSGDSLGTALAGQPGIVAVAARTKVTAMVSSAKTGSGVTVKGVVPHDEETISSLPGDVIDGGWLTDSKKNRIVLGSKLAEKLDVKLHSRVVITLQTIQGDLTGGAFKIEGIFKTHNSTFDESNVFVNRRDISRLLGADGPAVHEIAVLLPDYHLADSAAAAFNKQFPALHAQTWNQIQPETGMMESLMNQMMFLFVIIIMFALSFGIVNTMLMAVLDRRREFGMLMAVGMSNGRIFSMIMLETVFLALTGGSAGIVLGAVVIAVTAHTGIDLSGLGQGLAALGYNPLVYPFIDASFFAVVAVMVIITGILASIYPALKALGLNPADAVRSDL